MRIIYLSGKIEKEPNFKEIFKFWKKYLKITYKPCLVFNPAKLAWIYYLFPILTFKFELFIMNFCNHFALIPNWSGSIHTNIEMKKAAGKKFTLFFLENVKSEEK